MELSQGQPFQPFEMERLMSKWENVVEYNMSESGVHPMTLGELLTMTGRLDAILGTEINYPQANGIQVLRERIAAMYPGAGPENVLVTVGCIEANYLAMQTLLTPGDEIVLMFPNYTQIWGIAKNLGVGIQPIRLQEDSGWMLEPELSVTDRVRLIAICNPNNPTGHILTENEMNLIVGLAEKTGAWLLADEVYAGAEREREEKTPSFWGRYDKVVAMSSLSKAYGLPGLRIGWTVGPAQTVDEFWKRHEYLTISAGMLDNHLAAQALAPGVRKKINERARYYIRRGFPILEEWIRSLNAHLSVIPPDASAVAFIRYNHPIHSVELIERLRDEKSVLVVPGEHFGIDQHFRVSYGLEPDFLREGLRRIGEMFEELG